VTDEKRTPMYDEHVAAGAKMVPFAGYQMPIEYSGIIAEHRAVRGSLGMFDLSHMGEFVLRGQSAVASIDRLVTNDISGLEVWQARYTPLTRDDGGIVDDILVYRFPDHIFLVVNASNIDKDFGWIAGHLGPDTTIENISEAVALIAIQGPKAASFLQSLTTTDIDRIGYYHFAEGEVAGIPVTISRTGYTGEDGLELYVDSARAVELWRHLQEKGEPFGLTLIGLGARDTLRLEAGLALYGNDISDNTTPLEASLGWTVKMAGNNFIGKDALARQKQDGLGRRLVAFSMTDRSIPRPHYPVFAGDKQVGEVTSGSFSPTFSKGIGFAYIESENARVGTKVEIDIRGRRHPAEIVKKPIYRRTE
jgi:aminomethyltransferase